MTNCNISYEKHYVMYNIFHSDLKKKVYFNSKACLELKTVQYRIYLVVLILFNR